MPPARMSPLPRRRIFARQAQVTMLRRDSSPTDVALRAERDVGSGKRAVRSTAWTFPAGGLPLRRLPQRASKPSCSGTDSCPALLSRQFRRHRSTATSPLFKGKPAVDLQKFILENIEPLIEDWVSFARTLPGCSDLPTEVLCDHAAAMLEAIAADIPSEASEPVGPSVRSASLQRRSGLRRLLPAGPDAGRAEANGRVRPFSDIRASEVLVSKRPVV